MRWMMMNDDMAPWRQKGKECERIAVPPRVMMMIVS
jgi:hypothetical protein